MKRLFYLLAIVLFPIVGFAQDSIPEGITENPKQHFVADNFPDGIYEIVLYSLDGCGRCETISETLKAADIDYFVFTIDNDKKQNILDMKISESLEYPGLGYAIKFPVIEINGKMHNAVENHSIFIQDLINFMSE